MSNQERMNEEAKTPFDGLFGRIAKIWEWVEKRVLDIEKTLKWTAYAISAAPTVIPAFVILDYYSGGK